MSDLIPNFRPDLILEAAQVEGKGDRAQLVIRTADILAFDLSSGHPMPVTLLGYPLPADGSVYAILNRADKSRTLLDGTRFWEYRGFADFVYGEAERVAAWHALGEGSEGPGEGRGDGLEAAASASATGDSPAPGSGLLSGVLAPSRWR